MKTKIILNAFISLGFGLMLISGVNSVQAATFYVNAVAPAGGDGSSWQKAFNNLDSALIAAKATMGNNQIWIAKGTYKPSIIYGGNYTGSQSNLKTFKLPNNVAIYGGFAGNETNLDARNLANNPTLLSGDLAGNDINTPSNTKTNKTDNAWHVLTADGVTGITLDSLVVLDGYAAGPDKGALQFPQATIQTLDYTHAAGGGLQAINGAQVTLNNMIFMYNAADRVNVRISGGLVDPNAPGRPAEASGGGAIVVWGTNAMVTVSNSVFKYNNAFHTGSNGGAISALLNASYSVSSSTFTHNTGNRNGGALHAKDANMITVAKSIFKNNKVTGTASLDNSGGAIGTIDTDASVSSSIFENNSSGPVAGGGAILFHAPFDDGTPYMLEVDNSVFTNNHAAIIGGGAINIFGFTPHEGTHAMISNSLFINNTAIDGGALYIDSIPTVLTNSTFIGNRAGFDGGAIFASNFGDAVFSVGLINLAKRSQLSISNTLFQANSVEGIPRTKPLFIFDLFSSALIAIFGSNGEVAGSVNTLHSGGGAIAVELGGNTSISNSAFFDNRAASTRGGALLVGGSAGSSLTPAGGVVCRPVTSPTCERALFSQNYLTISSSICFNNRAAVGNNHALIDPAMLGHNPNGVDFVGKGSCN